jgi:hypothetical protein
MDGGIFNCRAITRMPLAFAAAAAKPALTWHSSLGQRRPWS